MRWFIRAIESKDVPLSRLKFLTDIIFASAMTLSALGIDLPPADADFSNAEVNDFLLAQLDAFGTLMITFIIVAIYWFKDVEHFSYLERVDQRYGWLQIFYLIGIVLVPFTNEFATAFRDSTTALIMYSVNLFMIGAFSVASWSYAIKGNRLVDPDLDPGLAREIRSEALLEPAIALISIAAVFISPDAWNLCFLLIPLVFMFQRRWRAKRGKAASAS